MDGLRLALIIAGIVVVAAVYWWTARRRQIEREAGEFDRFDAWTDDRLDPLADDPLVDRDSVTQTNPALADDPDGPADADSVTQPNPNLPPLPDEEDDGPATLQDPAVLKGLEAIAESLETRRAPTLGDVDGVVADAREEAERPARPAARAPRETPAPRARPKAPPARGGRDARAAEPPPAAEPVPEMVVVINVMAPVGATFDGPPLREALENAGLKPGDMQLYHYHTEAQREDQAPMFSALNMVKPGTLTPEQFEGMRTPGVALVMRLPGPERPVEAFELMHGTASAMAAELGGRLCDETRSALTRQALNLIRERVAELARRQRVGG